MYECPVCHIKHTEDWPVHANGRRTGRGCRSCYQKQGGQETDWYQAWLVFSGRVAMFKPVLPR